MPTPGSWPPSGKPPRNFGWATAARSSRPAASRQPCRSYRDNSLAFALCQPQHPSEGHPQELFSSQGERCIQTGPRIPEQTLRTRFRAPRRRRLQSNYVLTSELPWHLTLAISREGTAGRARGSACGIRPSDAGDNVLEDDRRATPERLEGMARRRSTILGGSRRTKRRRPFNHPDLDYRIFEAPASWSSTTKPGRRTRGPSPADGGTGRPCAEGGVGQPHSRARQIQMKASFDQCDYCECRGRDGDHEV
jgi:hypothetical protein